MKASPLQALLLTAALLFKVSESHVTDNTFLRCPKGFTSSGQQLDASSVRSKLECLSKCSRIRECAAVNTCPMSAGTDKHACTLLREANPSGSCSGLDVSEQPCVYMEKLGFQPSRRQRPRRRPPRLSPKRHTELVCENGGTPNGDHCSCPITHGGRTWTGRRANNGFGDDLNAVPNSESFFIGLQRLHELLSQAPYNNHIFMSWENWAHKGSAYYDNFTIGPESTGFALTYSNFFTTDNHADNGLVDVRPVVFSTQDNDIYGCAAAKLAAGWYGTDCTAYSVFADNFLWPVRGVDTQIDTAVFNLVRYDDFYDP
ncbi:hypothetical protein BaRGS_00024637 [Batillaria attramentaria]|uniref:Fibrinogen C-terminal domain-containing protein n=1 Tax=Batillaria attramentaria TaxID=370345 RepID=A0ABD0KAL6_9CAEN